MVHELIANRTFPFVGYWGGTAHCGLRIFREPGGHRPDVVIVTELACNRGIAVRHAAAALRLAVCEHYKLDPECLAWIEHTPVDGADRDLYWRIEFLDGPHAPKGREHVARRNVTRPYVERLVGGPLRALTPT